MGRENHRLLCNTISKQLGGIQSENKVVILVIHYFSVFVGVIVGVLLANPCTEEVRARSFVVFVRSCVRTFTGLFIQVCRKIFNSFKLASLVWRILIFMICSLLCF